MSVSSASSIYVAHGLRIRHSHDHMYKKDGYFVHPGMASEPLESPEFHDFRNSPASVKWGLDVGQ